MYDSIYMIIVLEYTKINDSLFMQDFTVLQAHVFCLNTEAMTKWVLTNY